MDGMEWKQWMEEQVVNSAVTRMQIVQLSHTLYSEPVPVTLAREHTMTQDALMLIIA